MTKENWAGLLILGLQIITGAAGIAYLLAAQLPQETLAFQDPVFLVSLFAGIPAALVVMLGVQLITDPRNLRFMVKNPTVETSIEVEQELNAYCAWLSERLQSEGFSVQPTRGSEDFVEIQFAKEKTPALSNFTDHAFFGEATLVRDGEKTLVDGRLSLKDTLLLETGEMGMLEKHFSFLFGSDDAVEAPKMMDMTLFSGVVIPVMAVPLFFLMPELLGPPRGFFLTTSIASVIMVLIGLVLSLKSPSRAAGLVHGGAALIIAVALIVLSATQG